MSLENWREKRIRPFTILCLVIISVISVSLFGEKLVFAQAILNQWTTPDLLFESEDRLPYPSIIADQSGRLHLFWQYVDPDIPDIDQIYYSQWDGSDWSIPLDIVPDSQAAYP